MIVAIVVDDVHFLVNFFKLFENLNGWWFGSVLDHLVVDCVDVAS